MRRVIVTASLSSCFGFAPPSTSFRPLSIQTCTSTHQKPPLFLSGPAGEEDFSPRRQSRFEGMQREPTAAELSIIDDMITKLSDAKPYELPNAVSRAVRVVSSPRFFLRIAERVDEAKDPIEKEKLSALADNLTNTVKAVVSMTEDSLDERAKDVEKVVKAASEPDSGEFLVPLSKERLDAMKSTLENLEAENLDEGFLSTVDSWMNKAHEDGMDGMVTIMQKALQMYAGTAISRARIQLQANAAAATEGGNSAETLFEKTLNTDTDEWDAEIRKGMKSGDVSKDALVSEVQKTMESVILGLENGSMAQRVQAEYLRELVTRIEAL